VFRTGIVLTSAGIILIACLQISPLWRCLIGSVWLLEKEVIFKDDLEGIFGKRKFASPLAEVSPPEKKPETKNDSEKKSETKNDLKQKTILIKFLKMEVRSQMLLLKKILFQNLNLPKNSQFVLF
jgi:hypothetical protein